MPAIGSDGTLYVGSDNKKLFALDSTTGTKKWEFLTMGEVRSSPVIDPKGNLCFGSNDKNVYSIPVSSGLRQTIIGYVRRDSRTGLAKCAPVHLFQHPDGHHAGQILSIGGRTRELARGHGGRDIFRYRSRCRGQPYLYPCG